MGTGWRRARIALGLGACTASSSSSDDRTESGQSPREKNSPKAAGNPSPTASASTTPRSEGRTPRLIVIPRQNCGICFSTLKPGRGFAIFTAECSHVFHFHCVSTHIQRGGKACPVCFSIWKDAHLLTAPAVTAVSHHSDEAPVTEVRLYDDDEPLLLSGGGAFSCRRFNSIPEEESESASVMETEVSSNAAVSLTIVPEFPALVAGKNYEDFALLLRIKAPALNSKCCSRNPGHRLLDQNHRPPMDVVIVLDTRTGSLSFRTMKRSLRLLSLHMSSSDRLAIVAFSSSSSKRLLPLVRMSAHGQRAARRLIESLDVIRDGALEGNSNGSMTEAVRKAGKLLSDRRERNPATSILLLSHEGNVSRRYAPKLSASFASIRFPVHTFGFSNAGSVSDGNSTAGPVTLADGTGNTFSYVNGESPFAQCIGTLLRVSVQDLRLEIECSASGSGNSTPRLGSLYAAVQKSKIQAGRKSGTIFIGDLYVGEEREFVVELKIPPLKLPGAAPMDLFSVRCSFTDPLTQEPLHGETRTLALPVSESTRGIANSEGRKVERFRNRLVTTRAIREARHFADKGEMTASRTVLSAARSQLLSSESSISLDEHMRAIDAELAELMSRWQYRSDVVKEKDHVSASMLDLVMRFQVEQNEDPLTPRSAWREAERLARVAIMRKALTSRSDDLHGFEDARF